MQNTNVPQGWNFSEFGTFAFLAKDKYEPDANEHKRCIELEHIEKETGKLISVSDSSTHTSVKNKFATNDVLFGKLRPYLKKYYKPDFEGVCSTEIWVLRGKREIIQEYLFLLIQSDKFISACNVSTGSRMPRADWSFVSETPFLLPPIEEQKKIAEILGTWDRALEELSNLITEKKELKRGLMQRLLNGAQRLPGFTKPWKKTKLHDVAEISKGTQLNRLNMLEEGYPVYNGGMIESGFTNEYNNGADTIIISEGGNSCGFVNFIKTKFWAGGHCYTVFCRDCVNKSFLYQLLKYNENKLMNLRVGSGLPNIQQKALNKFPLLLPSDSAEQKAIADVLSKADSEIDLLNQQLNVLREQKRGLMQKLLTGEIRVKVDTDEQ